MGEGDAIWCMFSSDLQIQKLDMKTGKVLDVIQLSKEDPDPHGLCINEGKLIRWNITFSVGGQMFLVPIKTGNCSADSGITYDDAVEIARIPLSFY